MDKSFILFPPRNPPDCWRSRITKAWMIQTNTFWTFPRKTWAVWELRVFQGMHAGGGFSRHLETVSMPSKAALVSECGLPESEGRPVRKWHTCISSRVMPTTLKVSRAESHYSSLGNGPRRKRIPPQMCHFLCASFTEHYWLWFL